MTETTGDPNDPLTDPIAARLFDVRGRRVLVTGAASGLGRAIAEVLAEGGATVTLLDQDPARLRKVADEIAESGGEVRSAVVDVVHAAQIDAAVTEVVAELGGLDVVFANAGIGGGARYADPAGRLESFATDVWDRTFDVNLDGAVNTMRAAARVMRRQGAGKIVATASTAGLRADPMVGYGYVAAKAALINVVRQAALDLAPHGVTVNAIAPGPFRTNIGGERGASPEAQRAWGRTVPLGRMGDPHELKGLALLLASEASSFMTGAVYPIDGGALALSYAP
jgi:NAD(P)-dependent dehydrogenase (short-subunit alcohol dehydrogenase family)